MGRALGLTRWRAGCPMGGGEPARLRSAWTERRAFHSARASRPGPSRGDAKAVALHLRSPSPVYSPSWEPPAGKSTSGDLQGLWICCFGDLWHLNARVTPIGRTQARPPELQVWTRAGSGAPIALFFVCVCAHTCDFFFLQLY